MAYSHNFKIRVMSIIIIATLLLAFLPKGIIYASSKPIMIMNFLYIFQGIVFSLEILYLYKRKNLYNSYSRKAIAVYTALLTLVTFFLTKDIYKTYRGMVYYLGIYTIWIILETIDNRKDKKSFKFICKIIIAFAILNFFSILIFSKGIYTDRWNGSTYLFGGKFTTFYIYYIGCCLYLIKSKNLNKIKFICLMVIGIFLCVKINCGTGIVCIFATIVFYFFRDIISKVKPWMILLTIIIITFLMMTDFVLNSKFIQYIVVDVLQKTANLTGRLEIYRQFASIISGYLLFGAGYENSIVSIQTNVGYFNAQNGILEIMTQTGIVGTAIFIFIVFNALKKGKKYIRSRENRIAAIFLLGMFVCSFVEISFNYYFYIILCLFSMDLSAVNNQSVKSI